MKIALILVIVVLAGIAAGMVQAQDKTPGEPGKAPGKGPSTRPARPPLPPVDPIAVNPLREDGLVLNWVVLGPFPNPAIQGASADAVGRAGFNQDFLTALGGEAKAVFKPGAAVKFTGADGKEQVARAIEAKPRGDGALDFAALLGKADYTVAYAFCQIEMDADRRAWLYLGSDDGYKLYVNGALAQMIWMPSRSMSPGAEEVPIELRKGLNNILVKVDNATGGWELALEAGRVPRSGAVFGVDHGAYYSASMKRLVGYNIYLPPGYAESGQRYPVVYYVHGRNSNENTTIGSLVRIYDRAVRDKTLPPAILVFGTGGSPFSFYTDGSDGQMSETTIIQELLPHVDATYRTIARREGRAMTGMSMGGFGALKFGFKHPELFGAVVAYAAALGREGRGDENDPYLLARANADRIRGKLPIRIACGTRDGLLAGNRRMGEILKELGIEYDFEELPDVGHSLPAIANTGALKSYQFVLSRLAPAK